MRLPIGCRELDELLRGGVESGTITGLYGGGGTGKTNICLQLTRNAALTGKKVVYIDTEGVSVERLHQIAGKDSEKIMNNTLFYKVHSFAEQEEALAKADSIIQSDDTDIGLMVVDSFTIFYRTLINHDEEWDVSKRLGRQMIRLLKIARKKDIPVVITTQVYHSQKEGTDKPLGGHILYHNSKTIIELRIIGTHHRICTLIKHRSVPAGTSVRFRIDQEGIVSTDKENTNFPTLTEECAL